MVATAKPASHRRRQARLQEALARRDTLLAELTHRFSNALMILAQVSATRARAAQNDETRTALWAMHQQVLSIAAVQQVLHAPAPKRRRIALAPYLTRLCEELTMSIGGSGRRIRIRVRAGAIQVDADHAFRVGLVVSELVFNAAKHAFPEGRDDCRVHVTYKLRRPGWRLIVSDNGVGQRPEDQQPTRGPRLGTSIVAALARQLHARMEIAIRQGRRVTLTCPGQTALPPSNTPQSGAA